ncbi:MAG TPA: hypothetical protein VFQ75_05240 [Candidatus Limnocylindrales bacterium]|nr:hypothetical protein [Candidatus Limnocylindrales bacterium]
MSTSPVPVPPSRIDRFLAVVDRVRHPRLTRELARATNGFTATGVVRSYTNDLAGRRAEAREGAILWHRGYRPPTRITHNAMWWTGGPAITITYSRELVPGFLSARSRAVGDRLGLTRR